MGNKKPKEKKLSRYLVLRSMILNLPEDSFEKPKGSIFIAYDDKEEAIKQSQDGKFRIYEIEITTI